MESVSTRRAAGPTYIIAAARTGASTASPPSLTHTWPQRKQQVRGLEVRGSADRVRESSEDYSRRILRDAPLEALGHSRETYSVCMYIGLKKQFERKRGLGLQTSKPYFSIGWLRKPAADSSWRRVCDCCVSRDRDGRFFSRGPDQVPGLHHSTGARKFSCGST